MGDKPLDSNHFLHDLFRQVSDHTDYFPCHVLRVALDHLDHIVHRLREESVHRQDRAGCLRLRVLPNTDRVRCYDMAVLFKDKDAQEVGGRFHADSVHSQRRL